MEISTIWNKYFSYASYLLFSDSWKKGIFFRRKTPPFSQIWILMLFYLLSILKFLEFYQSNTTRIALLYINVHELKIHVQMYVHHREGRWPNPDIFGGTFLTNVFWSLRINLPAIQKRSLMFRIDGKFHISQKWILTAIFECQKVDPKWSKNIR